VKIAMIGLDRMGTNMTERLVDVQAATLEVCRHSPGMKATATPGNQVGGNTVRRP
jgi:6-phosphogluconate dehydrogenase (decarboxylating)